MTNIQGSAERLLLKAWKGKKTKSTNRGVRWSLDRPIGFKEPRLRGRPVRPSKDLGSGLKLERVLTEMNARSCFDFNYSPKEGDRFHAYIRTRGAGYQYFRLEYRKGEWGEGGYSILRSSVLKNIAQGTVQLESDSIG